jgi:hypothetical protein
MWAPKWILYLYVRRKYIRRVVKKAKMDKLGAESGECDDSWYRIG